MNQVTSASAPIVAIFESAQSIRIIMIDNEPWFSVADVCDVLGYSNSRKALSDHCRDAGVTKRYISSGGQQRQASFINEGNLYRLVIKSRMPAAEKFESWVCDEVLPSIRKTGSYSVAEVREEYPPEEDDTRLLTEDEVESIKRFANGIADCLPTMTKHKVMASVYSRIKSPLRIARIDDLPGAYYDRTMGFLKSRLELARTHNRRQSAEDSAMLSKLTEGRGVAA